ncbi:MAG: hypothetical protein IPH88_04775 [Bacteroidales bacterium]|nr:hypothetical protein [Bacteroidales bacterium]
MKSILLLSVSALILFGCSNSGQAPAPTAASTEQNQVVISNDLENAAAIIPSWINEKTVVKMDAGTAHSGEYVIKIDDKSVYSYAYRENLENINQKLPKRIVVNGWVNSADPADGLSVIMDINDNNASKLWKSYSLKDALKTKGAWNEFTAYFSIDQAIQPHYQVKIYAFSGNKTAYLDDLKITFEY